MSQVGYRAIFFDLDGTLLPMDLDEFMGKYRDLLERYVVSKGMDLDYFRAGFKVGVEAMACNDSDRTNAEVFWEAFFGKVPEDPEKWIPLFNDFYAHDFGALGKETEANPCVAEAIKVLLEKGYPLVLATMPMFPLIAVEWRCKWAGVDPRAFKRITNFENSTSVKPRLNYYAQNLKAGNLQPSEVLMVGNNTKEDFACLELGMDGYLITDHLMNPNNFDIHTIKHGSFKEFLAWAEALPVCTNPADAFVTTVVEN